MDVFIDAAEQNVTMAVTKGAGHEIENWSLALPWSLDFGVWNLFAGVFRRPKLPPTQSRDARELE
jgi:hypothetical protein